MRKERPCIYCGYPTRHTSQTCPGHRDLVRMIPGFDITEVEVVQLADDDARDRMGGAGVVQPLATDPANPSRLVDR
jgi:hypothetical protein